ncbi:MAG TPA: methyltransferase [Ktedonobacterales bacterium]
MADAWNTTPTFGAQLVHAERVLAAAGSPAPWQEAAELLSYALDVPVPVLLAQPATCLRPEDVLRYVGLVRRRMAGEALPRITGHIAFMGLDLAIGRADSLIPADAERRAQIALEWGRHHAPGELAVAEIGTGCGAIALALATLEPRFTRIYAVDPSAATLETATANGARYLLNLVISWLAGDGLDVVPEPVDLIVCGRLDRGQAAVDQGERTAEVVSLRDVLLLKQAPAKLRPGGALIWSLDRAREAETLALIDLAFPDARVWVDPQAGEVVIVVVQLAGQPSGGETPDAES